MYKYDVSSSSPSPLISFLSGASFCTCFEFGWTIEDRKKKTLLLSSIHPLSVAFAFPIPAYQPLNLLIARPINPRRSPLSLPYRRTTRYRSIDFRLQQTLKKVVAGVIFQSSSRFSQGSSLPSRDDCYHGSARAVGTSFQSHDAVRRPISA